MRKSSIPGPDLKDNIVDLAMILREYKPHAALREFIRWYRICHFDFAGRQEAPVKAYSPRPETVLHFFTRDAWSVQKVNYQKQVYSSLVLAGQRTGLCYQYTGTDFISIQIVFQPGAVHRITGIPAPDLSDQHYDAGLIFNSGIHETLERLKHAISYEEMIALLESFSFHITTSCRADTKPVDTIARQMIGLAKQPSLSKLAAHGCLSSKQFSRVFQHSIGVTPKMFSRIIRFNHAYNIRNAYPHRDWLTIAMDCGFSDYQHMAKDYIRFTGMTPEAFHHVESTSPERTLGLTDPLYRNRIALD